MKLQQRVIVLALALGGIVTCPVTQAQGSSAIQITPGEIKWSANPALPKGAKTATLRGDPKQPGPFVARAEFPANYKIPPHTHPDERTITVLSGTLYYAEGDKWDEKKLKKYPAGSLIIEPGKVPHFLATKGKVTIQAAGTFPSGNDYIDPKDDPRKK